MTQSRPEKLLLIAGILLVAVNLRPALASVGPLVGDIRLSTGLSNSQVGLLTTLPLIAFGVISTLTPLFTRRFGMGGTLLGAMALLAVGAAIRMADWVPALYIGTVLIGIAIAFGNVLMPSLAKRNFAAHSGWITSLYSGAMGLGASMAAGLSVPLAYHLDLGWRRALGFWAIPALIAFVVWIPQLSRLQRSDPKRSFQQAIRDLGTSRLAWKVALYMGLQSFTYYVILAWLPAIVMDRGFDASFSGWMLSLSQATGVVGSLIIPIVAGRGADQRGVVLGLAAVELAGLAGLFFAYGNWLVFWISILGFVLGGSFGLALLFLVVRSKDADTVTELSGMAQSIGYLVAATGPTLIGSLFDLTGAWTIPLLCLFVTTALKLFVGLGAGSAATVD